MENQAPATPPAQTPDDIKQQLAAIMKEVSAEGSTNQPYWAKGDTTAPPTPATPPVPAAATPPQRPGTRPPAQQPAAHSESKPEPSPAEMCDDDFLPLAAESLEAARLTDSEVESLVLKCLLAAGTLTGANVAERLCLPFALLQRLLAAMKVEQLIVYKKDAGLNDFQYQLTDQGADRARRLSERCSYYGAAPVAIEDYIAAIQAQTISVFKPTLDDLKRAFGDLTLDREMFSQIGQALHAGRGMFLYGSPGNGKTSIAQRVTSAFGEAMWIPKCLGVHGEIVRLYDPSNHEPLPLPKSDGLMKEGRIDQRWIRIRRPTIVVGGELTMDSLELKMNRETGLAEAPLQLKSNGGTLVIDDFGRQRISTDELLNRWIVPLEMGYDFLNLASGRKIQVPFDQLIVFSTNLQPKDLVDEAFLRRIPYKIDVQDPSEKQYRGLLKLLAKKMGLTCDDEMVNYLIDKHYKHVGRPLRFCHPRDLLRQVKNYCSFNEVEPRVTKENIDSAVKNYFSTLE